MNIILYVFSGTGNTQKVAEFYEQEFVQNGHRCEIFDVTADFSCIPNPSDYDLAGFGYPVHAFNPPEIFLDFIRALPDARSLPAFVFKTSGEPLPLNDSSSAKLIAMLKRKGFDVCHERHFLMPYNILFRHKDAMAKQMIIYARALARAYAADALELKREDTRTSLAKRINSVLFRIEWGFAKLNGRAFKVNAKRCIDCGKCMRECPLGNIEYKDGKYRFGANCALCTRCAFRCPVDAISIGLLNGWKVNGEYHFERLIAEESIPFPMIDDSTQGGYRIYRKYYKKADAVLRARGLKAEFIAPDSLFTESHCDRPLDAEELTFESKDSPECAER